MNEVVSFVFIYLTVWWIVLFMVLPVGLQRDDSPELGNDSGAPKNVPFKKKFIITSLLALGVTLVIWLMLNAGMMEYFKD